MISITPIVTEKANAISEAGNRYSFKVAPDANKFQIKTAVERMFDGVKVARVNTMNCKGKKKRVRGSFRFGETAKTKKAYVFLTEDSKDIEIFTGL